MELLLIRILPTFAYGCTTCIVCIMHGSNNLILIESLVFTSDLEHYVIHNPNALWFIGLHSFVMSSWWPKRARFSFFFFFYVWLEHTLRDYRFLIFEACLLNGYYLKLMTSILWGFYHHPMTYKTFFPFLQILINGIWSKIGGILF